MSRTAIVVWLLAVSCTDSIVTEPMSVSAGQDVMLPCPCSEDTNKLVWQIGEEIVVNHCCKMKDPVHESYVNRTQVFLSRTKGNCSLLLYGVVMKDEKTFTCYIFDGEKLQSMHKVGLKVEDANQSTSVIQINLTTTENYKEPHGGFSVGVPLSLILVILAGLIVALMLIRKHKQRRLRMVQNHSGDLGSTSKTAYNEPHFCVTSNTMHSGEPIIMASPHCEDHLENDQITNTGH